MKRALKFVICLALVLFSLATRADASEDDLIYAIPDPGAPYPASGSCGSNAFWRIEGAADNLTLIIFGTGAMTDYEYDMSGEEVAEGEDLIPPVAPAGKDFSPAPYLPYYHRNIKQIIIEEGITETGTNAFANCSALTSVSLPSSLKTIDEKTFINATALTTVTVPEGVNRINAAAFAGCTSLTDISLPSTLTVLGRSAFATCTSLHGIAIPDGIRAVAAYLVEGCTSLTSFRVPPNATSIGQGAFMFCASLQSVSIPASVISVDDFAFFECTALQTVDYAGSDAQWEAVTIGTENDPLINAKATPAVPGKTKFVDVPAGAWYEDAVVSALENGVTNGTSETTFSPDSECTRAMAVTFLYKALREPPFEETKKISDFSDVSPDAYYVMPLRFAYNAGIIRGMGDGTFAPDAPCTRAHMVVMIYGVKGRPFADAAAIPFTDVARNSYYAEAVAYAYANGLTNGKTKDTFAPDDILTRAEAVSFIVRLDNYLK